MVEKILKMEYYRIEVRAEKVLVLNQEKRFRMM
jgi:hypothetical protein